MKFPKRKKQRKKAGYERDLRDEIIETLIISDIPRKYEEEVETEEAVKETEEDIEITAIIVPDEEEELIEELENLPEEPAEEDELFEKYNPDTVIIAEPEEKESSDTGDDVIVEPSGDFEEKLVLVPSGPKPPEDGDKSEYTEAVEKKPEVIAAPAVDEYSSTDTPVNTLDSSSYYLQIGAYKDFKSADHLASDLQLDYPVFLYKKGENGIYRVMAGPLKMMRKALPYTRSG